MRVGGNDGIANAGHEILAEISVDNSARRVKSLGAAQRDGLGELAQLRLDQGAEGLGTRGLVRRIACCDV